MTNFNWQTVDDDDIWQETAPPPTPPTPKPSRSRRWLGLTILVALIGLAVGIVYRQAQAGRTNVEAEVMESIIFIQETAQQGDGELFFPFLSGRNPSWAEQQRERVTEGIFFDRPSFGFIHLSTDNESEATLSADLQEAIVTTDRRYQTTLATGEVVETVLTETAVYRLGNTRWLLAPPLPTFWGEQQTYEGAIINLTYPERDEEWAIPIAHELDHVLAQLCDQPSMICPSAVRIRFDASNEAVESFEDTFTTAQLDPTRPLKLPAPTLVGLPTDEVGLQLLTEGYARQVATAVINTAINHNCCRGEPFYRSLVRYNLHQVGLWPWQIESAELQKIASQNVTLSDLAPLWWQDETTDGGEDVWVVDIAMQFVIDHLVDPYDSISILREIDEHRSLFRWIEDVTYINDATIGTQQVENAFWTYVLTEIQVSAKEERPFDLPTQQLQLTCQPTEPDFTSSQYPQMQLYVYNPQTEEAVTLSNFSDSFPIISPLPNRSGSLVQQINENGEVTTSLWQNQGTVQLPISETVNFITLGQIFPNTDKLLIYRYFPNSVTPFLLDLTQCQAGECELEELGDLMVWSPNGRYGVFGTQADFYGLFQVNNRIFSLDGSEFQEDNIPLEIRSFSGTRPNETVSIPIGEGRDPFWLDDETFGYILDQEMEQTTIFIGTPTTEARPVITMEELNDLIPDDIQSIRWLLRPIYVMPVSDEEAILAISNPSESETYLFSWTRADNSFRFLFDIDTIGAHTLALSTNGRWLAMNGVANSNARNMREFRHFVRVYDRQTDTFEDIAFSGFSFFPNYSFDWSADSRWLVVNGRFNTLALYAPETNYYELQTHNLGACGATLWVEN